MERDLKVGDIVRHFKRDDYIKSCEEVGKEYDKNIYLYEIVGFATHTETKEKLVVYKTLYNNEEWGIFEGKMYCRPFEMFLGEVDHEKYPNATQKYRFEKFVNITVL